MMYGRGISQLGWCSGYGFWSNGWYWLAGIGILLIVIAVTFLLARKYKGAAVDNGVMETLRIKYAKGEITEEEYIARKNVLERK
ncbi:MAG: SHOCT domain-containing protein [Clostridia bacterium]|nr:SHOCT domain-containing protein [Clostridia bacterium]